MPDVQYDREWTAACRESAKLHLQRCTLPDAVLLERVVQFCDLADTLAAEVERLRGLLGEAHVHVARTWREDDLSHRIDAALADKPSGGEATRPRIVCLCGSTRFMSAFFDAGWQYTLDGYIVLSVGVCKHADDHGAEALGGDVAERLDELHKRKIDLADEVFVLNVGGYIGDSTRSEIDYALEHGKPVAYLEDAALDKPSGGEGVTPPSHLDRRTSVQGGAWDDPETWDQGEGKMDE